MEVNEKYAFISAPYRIDRKLYKYYKNINYAIDSIEKRQIHLDDPRSYNDPFDSVFSCRKMSDLVTTDSEREVFSGIIKYILSLPEFKQIEKHQMIVQSIVDLYWVKGDEFSVEKTEQPVINIIEKIYSHFDTNAFSLQEFIDTIDRGFVEKERAIHLDCRVSCFSEVKDSILMWSYYANNHEGVCLEFDISRLDKENELNQSIIKNLSRVHYSPIRAEVQYLAVGDTGLNFITSKADVWEHELEWRLICKTNEEYLPFDCISGIYLGVNFSQSSKEYKKLISVAAKYDWLPIYQGKLSLNRYEIEFEEDYSSNMQVYLKKNKQS